MSRNEERTRTGRTMWSYWPLVTFVQAGLEKRDSVVFLEMQRGKEILELIGQATLMSARSSWSRSFAVENRIGKGPTRDMREVHVYRLYWRYLRSPCVHLAMI